MKLQIENQKTNKAKYQLFVLATFTLSAIIVWIGYSLVSTYNKSSIEPNVKALLTPLDPSIDREIVDLLTDRFEPPEEFTILAMQGESGNGRQVRISGSSIEEIEPERIDNPAIEEYYDFTQQSGTSSGVINE